MADIRELFQRMEAYREMQNRLMEHKIRDERSKAYHFELRLKALSPASRIREKRMTALQAEEKLQERMQRLLRNRRHELALYIERLKGLSPLEKLNSGYSYVSDENGKNVRSVTQTDVGQALTIHVKDGLIGAVVDRVQPADN